MENQVSVLDENTRKTIIHFFNLGKKQLPNAGYTEIKEKALELFAIYEKQHPEIHGKHAVFSYAFDRILMPLLYAKLQEVQTSMASQPNLVDNNEVRNELDKLKKEFEEYKVRSRKLKEAYDKMKAYLEGLQKAYNTLKGTK